MGEAPSWVGIPDQHRVVLAVSVVPRPNARAGPPPWPFPMRLRHPFPASPLSDPPAPPPSLRLPLPLTCAGTVLYCPPEAPAAASLSTRLGVRKPCLPIDAANRVILWLARLVGTRHTILARPSGSDVVDEMWERGLPGARGQAQVLDRGTFMHSFRGRWQGWQQGWRGSMVSWPPLPLLTPITTCCMPLQQPQLAARMLRRGRRAAE